MEVSIHNILKEKWGVIPSSYILDPQFSDINEISTLMSESPLYWTAYDGDSKIKMFLHPEKLVSIVILSINDVAQNIQIYLAIDDNDDLINLLETITTEFDDDEFVEDEEFDDNNEYSNEIKYFVKTNEGLITTTENVDITPYIIPFWGKDTTESLESLFDNPDIYGIMHITGKNGSGKSSFMDFVLYCANSVERNCYKIPNNPIFFNDMELLEMVKGNPEPPVLFIDNIDWMINYSTTNYGFSPLDYITELLSKQSKWENTGPILVVSSVLELPENFDSSIFYRYELDILSKSQLDFLNKTNKTKIKGDLLLHQYWKEKNNIVDIDNKKFFGL